MARQPKPWYWKERKAWFVTIDGQRHRLSESKSAALEEFHKLMSSRRVLSYESACVIFDDFLTWAEENRAAKTFGRYKDFLQSFADECGNLNIRDLTAGHVTKWLGKKSGWNSTTKNNAITAVQRALNWATKNRGLPSNPIRGMEKPKVKRRITVIPTVEFETILAIVKDAEFRDLLIVSFDSGARPQEIKQMEARHLELDKSRAVIPTSEAKKNKVRAIYFPTDRSLEIIKRLKAKYPDGLLFRNRRGNGWTGSAIKCRFARMDGQIGKRIAHYDFRHSFITRKLLAGVDSHVVAALAGHGDTKMIDEVYSHVAQDHAFMLKQAQKEII